MSKKKFDYKPKKDMELNSIKMLVFLQLPVNKIVVQFGTYLLPNPGQCNSKA